MEALHEDDDDNNDEPIDPVDDIEIFEKEKHFPKSLISPSYALKSHVQRIVILYNPASGAKHGEKIAEHAIEKFESSGVSVNSIQLEKKGHAEELCQVWILSILIIANEILIFLYSLFVIYLL